jgi:hypothetical protein
MSKKASAISLTLDSFERLTLIRLDPNELMIADHFLWRTGTGRAGRDRVNVDEASGCDGQTRSTEKSGLQS